MLATGGTTPAAQRGAKLITLAHARLQRASPLRRAAESRLEGFRRRLRRPRARRASKTQVELDAEVCLTFQAAVHAACHMTTGEAEGRS